MQRDDDGVLGEDEAGRRKKRGVDVEDEGCRIGRTPLLFPLW